MGGGRRTRGREHKLLLCCSNRVEMGVASLNGADASLAAPWGSVSTGLPPTHPPVAISAMMQPSAHTSAGAPYSSPSSISGLRYHRVETYSVYRPASSAPLSGAAQRAKPKSQSLTTVASWETSTFSGLMSR